MIGVWTLDSQALIYFIFWIFVNLDVIKKISMFFPCDRIHPQPQGIFPLLARVLPQIINTCPHIQYPWHKACEKNDGPNYLQIQFSSSKRRQPNQFYIVATPKKENNGNFFGLKLREKLQTWGKIIKVSKPRNLRTKH